MYRTGWGMCFVVVCYYNGVCHGLRNQLILVIFNSENDPKSSQQYLERMVQWSARTESQFSLPGGGNNRQGA